MAFDAGSVEAHLTLDRSPFQRGLKDSRAEAKRFESNPIKARLELNDRQARDRMAKFRTSARRNVATKLELNDKAARERMTKFRESARRNITTRLELNDKAARTKLGVFRRIAGRAISIRVDLDDKAARLRLAALRHAQNSQSGSGVLGMANRAVSGVAGGISQALGGIPVIGNVLGSALTGATGIAKFAGDAVSSLLERFTSLGSGATAVAGQVTTLVTSLGGMAAVAGAVIIAVNALIGAVIAFGGALTALVASLAAAVAGAGLLGAAFLGALGPAVLLGIGLFKRFQAVLQARQAHEQALKQAVDGQAQAERQRKTALEQVGQATQNLKQQTVAAYAAMKQSILDVANAQNAVQNATLGKEGARLQRRQALEDLKQFLHEAGATGDQISKLFQRFQNVDFNPASARKLFGEATGKGLSSDKLLQLQERLFAVKEATQGVKNSDLAYRNSLEELNKAEAKRADYLKRGIRAYAPYRTAVNQLYRAHTQLTRAQKATSRAQTEYERQLKKLTPTERGTLSRLNQLTTGFDKLSKRFSDPVFRAVNDVFDKLAGKGSVFGDVLDKLGSAAGDFVRSLGNFLTEPASIRAFRVMGDGAAYLTRQLGSRAFVNFLRIMRDLAVATMPSLKRIAREVGDVFAGWAGKTRNISQLRQNVVIPLVKNFRTWAGLAKDVLGLVVAIFRQAAPEGRSLAESMRLIVQRWTRWVNANPEKVRAFFRDAVRKTKEIVHWLRDAFVWLRDKLPAAADKSKKAFEAVWRVLKKAVDAARWLQNASTDVANTLGLGASPSDVVKIIKNDLAIVTRESANLKQHLSPSERQQSRARLLDALNELLSQRGSVGRQLQISSGDRQRLETLRRQVQRGISAGAPRSSRPHVSARAPRAGTAAAPPRRRPGDGDPPTAGAAAYHFHAHGIENPDQFLAKAARKLPRHHDFRKARARDLRLAGG